MENLNEKDLMAVKVFINNLAKATEKQTSRVKEHPCNKECDCFIELEPTQAVGIGTFRYFSGL